MRFIFVALLFFCFAFGDINKTIIYENNITLYQNLTKELNASDPAYALQKTLLRKIVQILTPKKSTLFAPQTKDAQKYIASFMQLNALLAKASQAQEEIGRIDAMLEDIKSDMENNSTLTTQLEYAYYLKRRKALQSFIQKVQQHQKAWLSEFIAPLNRLSFAPSAKKLQALTKELAAFDAKLKRLDLEYKRWEILQDKAKMARTQKYIALYRKKKLATAKKILSLQLASFFHALRAKDPQAVQIAHRITDFVRKELGDKALAKSYEESFAYLLSERIGSWQMRLLQLKTQAWAFLHQNTFLGMPLYKFAEALGIFLLFLLFRKIFALIILATLKKAATLTKSQFDDKLIEIIEGPLKFSFIILGLFFAFYIADVSSPFVDRLIKSLIIFTLFWLLYNAVVVLDEAIYAFARKFGRELYREIGAFFIKTLKIFIIAIGLVSILQIWDINVSAFLASLGLGGLAFALAAKDTAANLFGGLSILADRALKIDDWIKVGDVEGTVEEIGLRTTKVRTFEKSLITVPNQIIANNPIENFSRRNIRRIKMRIGLVYSTTHEQMEAILNGIRNMLQSHPGIAQDATLLVNFDEFGASELSIFIYCFTNTADWAKYLAIREDINLKIMEIVQRHGSDFAFPSESIYIEKLPKNEADEKNSDNR